MLALLVVFGLAQSASDLSETLRRAGRYEEAIEAAAGEETPRGWLAQARVHLEIGEDEKALPLLRRIEGAGLPAENEIRLEAEVELAGIAARRGEDAAGRFEEILAIHDRTPPGQMTAMALVSVGRALVGLGHLGSGFVREALAVFDEARALAPEERLPRLLAAELLADKGNAAEAAREFAGVLETDPRDARALMGIARIGGGGEQDPLEAALEINPRHPGARALRVVRLLEADNTEAALEAAKAGVADLPESPDAFGAYAAALFLADDSEGSEAIAERFFASFPGDPRLDLGVGFAAERTRRYREAAERAEQALARAPESVAARKLLGINQLRLGAMEAGRASLESAFARDPFDVLVKNTLDLLDELDDFRVVPSPPFEFVLPPSEADLLLPYLERVSHEALDSFRERYRFEPDGTIRIEIYDRSADFSVRTVGMTGLGAHGVCFGNTIALESPSARRVGEYHWLSTLWHELAHTVTMGLTGNRVPRWFTEGMSQIEERQRFGDGAPLAFYRALGEGRLLPLGDLDEGFLRPAWPGQVAVSYYHSSLVLEHMESAHGFSFLLSMLDGFSRGESSREILPATLDTPLGTLDEEITAALRIRFGDGAKGLAPLPDSAPLPELIRQAEDAPENFPLQLRVGGALESRGRDAEALPFLEQAHRIAPDYGGLDGASPALSRIHERAGRREKAIAALEEHLTRAPADHEGWLRLARLREEGGDLPGAAEALEAGLFAWPMNRDPHERLADLYQELGEPEGEIRERRAVLATDPPDRAGALYRLAAALDRSGDRKAARRRVLEALEIAPTYDEALGLLRELADSGS